LARVSFNYAPHLLINYEYLLHMFREFEIEMQVESVDRLTRCFAAVREDLLRFLTRRAGPTAAEDILQDVWLKLRERDDVDLWREPRAVLFTTAANLATDAYRRAARAQTWFDSEADAIGTACPRSNPETQADAVSRVDHLASALEELPAACREAFLLNRLEGLSHVEIARRFGVCTKSVQRYIDRALRHCLHGVE
jgi:RNA polymerase sigma factor (sigma-70 family)